MPRSTREWARRKLAESTQSVNWAGYHLSQVIEVYQKDHPEISDPLLVMSEILSQLIQTIEKVRGSF